MEQLVLLLIIGLISLINWLMQRSAEMREKRKLEKARQESGDQPLVMEREDTGAQDADRADKEPAEDPSESMRKLMEALGVPMEEAPPVRRQPPSIPAETAQPPVILPEEPPFVPPSPDPVFEAPPVRKAPPLPRIESPAVARPKWRPKPQAPVVAAAPSRIRDLLSSPSGLRDAIVLSEILGTPRGLR
jgi:hypothetical protein